MVRGILPSPERKGRARVDEFLRFGLEVLRHVVEHDFIEPLGVMAEGLEGGAMEIDELTILEVPLGVAVARGHKVVAEMHARRAQHRGRQRSTRAVHADHDHGL